MFTVVNESDYGFIPLRAISYRTHLAGRHERAVTDSVKQVVLARFETFLSDVG